MRHHASHGAQADKAETAEDRRQVRVALAKAGGNAARRRAGGIGAGANDRSRIRRHVSQDGARKVRGGDGGIESHA